MDQKLFKYADLLVRAGGNVQPGQPVVISSDVADAGFARLVSECAYNAGASEVVIDWTDELSARMKYLRASDEVFDMFPPWRTDRFKYYDDRNAVYLHILSSDPDLLQGVEPGRIKRATKVMREGTKAHRAVTMTNERRWSLAAVPSPKWAAKVFPELAEKEAVEKLWGLIFKGARADGENPVKDWEAHRNNFLKRVDYLNETQFSALKFKNSLGTDLYLPLIEKHIWVGGGAVGRDGVPFFPNMPTEEIFTMPARIGAEGRVVASLPLSYQGSLIEGFWFEFKNGRVTDFGAEKNADSLKLIVDMDEGSRFLGEVALISNNSPIAQMKTLFYETLFDENASCHLALGKAYPYNLAGGCDMTERELAEAGANDSLLHVDFMFGTEDMSIIGIEPSGTEKAVMEKGEFCI